MSHPLTTATLTKIFTDGVKRNSGRVTETFDDDSRLFMRSLLPHVKQVRRNDLMQGGIALRATETEISLHPYLFRKVCQNGAITARSLESLHVGYSEFSIEDDLAESLHKAIDACSEESVFTTSVRTLKTVANSQVDFALALSSQLSQIRDSGSTQLILQIIERFTSDRDQSQFGLMNAVTSVARDTRDPEQKWRLEELGGAIGAKILPIQPEDRDALQVSREEPITV